MIRIIIAGGRKFNNYDLLVDSFKELILELKEKHNISKSDVEIISGGASGADKLGELLAQRNSLKLSKFPADWNLYGKSAGYKRNAQMASYASQEQGILLAFWDGTSKGTGHMIDLAMKAGLERKIVKY